MNWIKNSLLQTCNRLQSWVKFFFCIPAKIEFRTWSFFAAFCRAVVDSGSFANKQKKKKTTQRMAGGGGADGPATQSSVVTGVFAFNLIIGVGALALPNSMGHVGYLFGACLLLVVGVLGYATSTFVVEAIANTSALKSAGIDGNILISHAWKLT
jgi:hypothetical protein